jgi:MraZ protein
MLIGRYYHTLEKNGRLALPKTLREQTENWVVTRGLDGGLFLFPQQDFKKQIQELTERTFTKKRNRDFVRLMVNSAQEVTPDSLGRVLLPEYLIDLAQLSKQVVVVGSFQYLEIWDQKLYHSYLDQLEPQAEQLAESLGSETESTKL